MVQGTMMTPSTSHYGAFFALFYDVDRRVPCQALHARGTADWAVLSAMT